MLPGRRIIGTRSLRRVFLALLLTVALLCAQAVQPAPTAQAAPVSYTHLTLPTSDLV